MNPTLRGFLMIALIAVVVVVLQLEATLTALFLLAQIAFFLAIAYFIFLLWRDRRQEISMWSSRSRVGLLRLGGVDGRERGRPLLRRRSGTAGT